MNQELDKYKNYLINQKYHEKLTVDAYIRDIKAFSKFIYRQKINCRFWHEVTLNDAKDYRQELIEFGKCKTSINHSMTSLRLFYDYLIIRGEAQSNPFRKIEHIKTKREAPQVLNNEEISRLVNAPMREYQILIETLDGDKPRRYGKFIFLRDQLILEILHYSGMKVGELVKLRDTNINCDFMKIQIAGKEGCNKDRVLKLPECVIVTFKDYVRNRNERWPNITWKKKPILLRNNCGKPITQRSVRRKIADYAQKSGLHPGISPETIRATFALRAIRNGANTETIQFLLGFEELSYAESYVYRFKSSLYDD